MDSLYFFRADNGLVKIGRSRNVRARLNAVRCSSPLGIMLWAELPGRGCEEVAWHGVFSERRFSGEWFRWCVQIARAVRLAQNGKDWWKRSITEPDTDRDRMLRAMLEYLRTCDRARLAGSIETQEAR